MSRLSKSQFVRGMQCQKSLWLYKDKYELRTEPDDAQQAIFDTGTNVGVLAQQLFPDGIEFVYDPDRVDENIKKTQELMEAGTKTIYEAHFLHDNILVLVDILHKGEDGWEVYEVKSSTGLYTDKKNPEFKAQYKYDIAVQYYVLKGNDIDVSKVSMVYVNNKYVFKDKLDIKQLFTDEDVTDIAVDYQSILKDDLINLRKMLDGDKPKIDIGPHCSEPYDCDFHDHCWKHIPATSVFDINRMRWNKKFEMYYNGIIKFEDIPADFPLNAKERLQVDTELNPKDFINPDGIMKFLEQLEGPIGMIDFETFNPAVPSFDGQRPYQVIPFQYSLHVLDEDKLDHSEYLGEPGKDPQPELIDRMIADTKDCKTILVYNIGFERTIVKELAKRFPDKADDLLSIADRMIDMMKPFQDKHYYTKEMRGSYSIKLVLPALVPELSYDGLEIGDGGAAMNIYEKLQTMTDTDEVEKIKSDLLKYCGLDTYAMVKILEKMKEVV